MTSWLLLAPATLGVLRSLPFHLHLASTSHLSTSEKDMGDPHPHRSSVKHSLLSNCKWHLVDPAKRTSSLHCLAPRYLRGHMRYLGCSYGYFIFSNLEQYLLVDVYSGATVRPPRLKSSSNHEIYYGILVAPINSPNLQLLLFSRSSMFQWQVGASSWLEHPLDCERILQIVFFKGEMFAMDFLDRLHRIRLAPQLTVQEVPAVWEEDDTVAGLIKIKPWLVVCGGMLLLVELSARRNAFFGFSATFKVFRLNFSVEPAKWVKVDNLGNNALFVSFDRRNPTFSCMNPERWEERATVFTVPVRLQILMKLGVWSRLIRSYLAHAQQWAVHSDQNLSRNLVSIAMNYRAFGCSPVWFMAMGNNLYIKEMQQKWATY